MKTESGPLKYQLARKPIYKTQWADGSGTTSQLIDYEYFLQGWFEWTIPRRHESGLVYHDTHGEWRTLETVDLPDGD